MDLNQPPPSIQLKESDLPVQPESKNVFGGVTQETPPRAQMMSESPNGQYPHALLPFPGKPSPLMPVLASLVMVFSVAVPFLSLESNFNGGLFGDFEMMCCLLCNGNAISLGVLGVWSFQYASWEQKSGKSVGAGVSYLFGIIALILAVLFVGIYFIVVGQW
jgi:hypothetical protein